MMNRVSSSWFQYVLTAALLAVTISATGCKRTVTPASRGLRGESCQARNDCASGLACVSSVCVQNDYSVAVSARSCDIIECTVNQDCCEPTGACADLEEDCLSGDAGACSSFESLCQCLLTCTTDNRCVTLCTEDAECGFGFCVNQECVGCRMDEDCPDTYICSENNFCVPPCGSDADCPYFHACQEGTCVDVGCQTDRECIALTEDPNAVCVTRDGEKVCEIPCQTDAECNGSNEDYNFQACQDGRCVYVGCETDEECRIALEISPGDDDTITVCR